MASNLRKGKIPYRTTGVGEYVDETFTLGGFFGDWAHLFRRNNLAHPVRWSDPSLMYGGLDSAGLAPSDATDPRGAPLRLLEGDGVAVSLSHRAQAMPFAEKNVDFHQVRFYDRGHWLVETELGALEAEPGDFVVLPRGLIYRETPRQADGNAVWIFETTSPVHLAESLWDSVGFVGMFIDYSEMDIPEPGGEGGANGGDGETEVRVLVDGEEHFLVYGFDPCNDVVGWLGDPVVFKMSAWAVPAPGTSRGHLPPPAHAVLWSDDKSFFFNAMAFAPFPNTPAPDGSIGAPSHANDYDEVWLTHSSAAAPEGHLWLLPRTIPHPGFKRPPGYPKGEVQQMREMRINFDTKAKLRWTEEARGALFDDPVTALYTSFMGVPLKYAPEAVRARG
jgi:homogentisate 1,2-dioxygenase